MSETAHETATRLALDVLATIDSIQTRDVTDGDVERLQSAAAGALKTLKDIPEDPPIKMTLTFVGAKIVGPLIEKDRLFGSDKPGAAVAVRPCSGILNPDGDTFFGIYLGEAARRIQFKRLEDGTIVAEPTLHNPAIYVPALDAIVMGDQSWWGSIDGPEALSKITDETIEGQWYVRALRAWMKEDGDEQT